MTERTIRSLAKELAGQFYDIVRTAESQGEKIQLRRGERVFLQIDPKTFGKTYPTVKDYLIGRKFGSVERSADGMVRHVDDGNVTLGAPGWASWYDLARQTLVGMLGNIGTTNETKAAIMDAIVEDRQKQLAKQGAEFTGPQRQFLQR
jgi:hypothetical protein